MAFEKSMPSPEQVLPLEDLPLKLLPRAEQDRLAGLLLRSRGTVGELIADIRTVAEATHLALQRAYEVTPPPVSLTPSTQETDNPLLAVLEQRVKESNLKNVQWEEVKAAMLAAPSSLDALAQMEAAGHVPNVYMQDAQAFYIGTCAPETPPSTRRTVYDELAQQSCSEFSSGHAVGMAHGMGASLMPETHYRALQNTGRFDEEGSSFLLTPEGIRTQNKAQFGTRDRNRVVVAQYDANKPFLLRGFRCYFPVPKS